MLKRRYCKIAACLISELNLYVHRVIVCRTADIYTSFSVLHLMATEVQSLPDIWTKLSDILRPCGLDSYLMYVDRNYSYFL